MRMRKKDWARPELAACPYYTDTPEALKGNWQAQYAKKQPLHLDLGCGKCTFLAELSFRHPEINYLGIDQSPDVLGVARRNIESRFQEGERAVENVMLTAYDIEKIAAVLDEEKDQVERIYINFCNPWPKARHHKRRLTHTIQLLKYRKLLCEDGEIWFKTDNDDLFLATLRYLEEAGFEIYAKTFDLHAENDPKNIESEHEVMFTAQGIRTKALKARMLPKIPQKPQETKDKEQESQ